LYIIFARVKVQDGISYKKLVELTINFFSSNQNVQQKLESKMKEDSKVTLYYCSIQITWFSSQNQREQ